MNIYKRGKSRSNQLVRTFLYGAAIFAVGLYSLSQAYGFALPTAFFPGISIVAGIVVAAVPYGLRRRRRRKRLRKCQSLQEVYVHFKSKPTDFESHVADIFREYGFKAKVTPPSKDGGVDIFLQKDGKIYVAEVKLYGPKNKVSVEKIQKLHSAMVDQKAHGAVFVTTGEFTGPAAAYGARNGMILIDGVKLQKLMDDICNKRPGDLRCQVF